MKKILDNTNIFAKNIKYLRKSNHMTQQQFADLFGKTYATISMWENGTRSPITADIIEIANHFNIQPVDLIGQNIAVNYSPITTRENITDRESDLLSAFRKLTAEQQISIVSIVESMVK